MQGSCSLCYLEYPQLLEQDLAQNRCLDICLNGNWCGSGAGRIDAGGFGKGAPQERGLQHSYTEGI